MELCEGTAVSTVVAAAERTVRTAARIRAALGLIGVDEATAARCTDKIRMKRAVTSAGVRCARYLTHSDRVGGAELAERLGLPIVLKRSVGSGGRDSRICERADQLPDSIDPGWLAESFVRGTEMSLESLVHGGEPIFVNLSEYRVPQWSNVVPATLSSDTEKAVRALNRQAIHALEVSCGVTHLELFLTDEGPVFGEIALRPPGGYLMELISRAYDLDFWRAWLDVERGLRPKVNPTACRFAAVQILHPGAGTLRAIEGVEAARHSSGVEQAVVRGRPGERIEERVGVGQELGHVLVTGSSRQEAIAHLEKACGRILISME